MRNGALIRADRALWPSWRDWSSAQEASAFCLSWSNSSLGNCAAVQQTLRRRDLVSRAAALSGDRLDVLVSGGLSFPHGPSLTLGHALAAGDQVDE